MNAVLVNFYSSNNPEKMNHGSTKILSCTAVFNINNKKCLLNSIAVMLKIQP